MYHAYNCIINRNRQIKKKSKIIEKKNIALFNNLYFYHCHIIVNNVRCSKKYKLLNASYSFIEFLVFLLSSIVKGNKFSAFYDRRILGRRRRHRAI